MNWGEIWFQVVWGTSLSSNICIIYTFQIIFFCGINRLIIGSAKILVTCLTLWLKAAERTCALRSWWRHPWCVSGDLITNRFQSNAKCNFNHPLHPWQYPWIIISHRSQLEVFLYNFAWGLRSSKQPWLPCWVGGSSPIFLYDRIRMCHFWISNPNLW